MCRRKRSYVTKLLTTVFILLVLEVSSQTVDKTVEFRDVEFRDVLKSRVREIQTGITQVYSDVTYEFHCHHYTVYPGDSIKILIFVWASEGETHAMRTCLYQGIKRIRMKIIRMLQSTQSHPFMPAKFCNRSLTSVAFDQHTVFGLTIIKKTKVITLHFYVIDSQSDGPEETKLKSLWYYENGIPTITSSIKNIGSHVRTLVCNSLQLTLNKTGKLWQRFVSVIGTSAENQVETMITATRNGSVSVPLYFDVLALNASRLGLLNDSHVELLSLSDLQVSCIKLDQYGLNTETNEIVHVDMTKELIMTTSALIIDEKLRVYVNVSIPVVSDESFGKYVCLTLCKLRTKNRKFMIEDCSQRKHFFIVLNDWRDENLALRKNNRNCLDDFNKVHTYAMKWAELIKKLREMLKDAFTVVKSLKEQVVLLALVLIILAGQAIYKKVKTRINLNVFNSMESVLQSIENIDDRIIKYDVFLSYSSKDRPWVKSTLLKFIESKGFKVCFDERDFLYGCSLVQAIAEAVYESHKVIAVVSPNYLKSFWCAQYEFLLTYTKILDKEATFNSLLLIKYKDCRMPPNMRCLKYLDYTKTTTACDDNRGVFMKMLSYILPFYPQVDACETSTEKQFFEHLTSWLGQPDIGEAH